MKVEKTWLSCREAAGLIGCSQRHMLNLIKKKNLSFERDESGKYIIQKAEFFRVFPEAMKVELDGKVEKSGGNEAMKVLEEKIRHLQEMMEEKKKQNDFLLGQLSITSDEKSKMLDAINNHARLLEFKETGGKGFNWWPFRRK
jgi:hypothetical protein